MFRKILKNWELTQTRFAYLRITGFLLQMWTNALLEQMVVMFMRTAKTPKALMNAFVNLDIKETARTAEVSHCSACYHIIYVCKSNQEVLVTSGLHCQRG